MIVALVFVGATLYISNNIVNKVAKREQTRAIHWASAIQKKSELVKLTNEGLKELQAKQKELIDIYIEAYKEWLTIFQSSNSIPSGIIDDLVKNIESPLILIQTDGQGDTTYRQRNISDSILKAENKIIFDSLVKSWSQNKIGPIELKGSQWFFKIMVYYDYPKELYELKRKRDSIDNAFMQELIENPELVPVLLLDSSRTKVVASNIALKGNDSLLVIKNELELMQENEPIPIDFGENNINYLFYANSPELKQLQYYPFIQLLIVGLFIFIGYVIFSTFRKAEQNQVWAGMAKETAHQIGTPLTSLMGWTELLSGMDIDQNIPKEMNKDIDRLTKITERFSKIGTSASLEKANLVETIKSSIIYLKARISKHVLITFDVRNDSINLLHSPPLIEWAIENICKNGIDAMEGSGKLEVSLIEKGENVIIDITDSGKGMNSSQQRSVFQPGYTTKKRGWGLGLTLVKRIIEENHNGKIGVLKSEPNKGTTFRIILRKKDK